MFMILVFNFDRLLSDRTEDEPTVKETVIFKVGDCFIQDLSNEFEKHVYYNRVLERGKVSYFVNYVNSIVTQYKARGVIHHNDSLEKVDDEHCTVRGI